MSKEITTILKLLKEPVDTSDPKVIMRRVGKERFRDIAYIEAARGRLSVSLEDVLAFADSWQIPRFPIYGNDVIAMGVTDGKKIGFVLTELERYWERHGYFLTRDELMKRMKHIIDEVNAR
jgi:poly(A) polymerase